MNFIAVNKHPGAYYPSGMISRVIVSREGGEGSTLVFKVSGERKS
jgi:hypothetical protein